MKSTLYILLVFLLLASCGQEDIAEKKNGYLQLGDVSVASSIVETVATRAVEEDLYIEITGGEDFSVVYQPGQFPQGKLELAEGTYLLKAYNEASQTPDANAPCYYVEQEFAIEAEKVSYVTVQVPMVNVAIRLETLGEDLENFFSNPMLSFYTTDESVKTELHAGEVVYLDYTEGMTFTYTLSMTNTDNETFTTEPKTYGNEEGKMVHPGHCYTISYSLETPTLFRSEVIP